jgi:REP element-mobilizing transposase RayT
MNVRARGSSNLRKGRVSRPGHPYLITTVTLDRTSLFADFLTARLVIRELAAADVDTLAYVLMPDHLHWLVQLRDEPLSCVMRRMKSRSAVAVNRYLGRNGAVWQDGYHDHALRADDDVRKTARYVISNPMRAGLVDSVFEYPHWDAVWM